MITSRKISDGNWGKLSRKKERPPWRFNAGGVVLLVPPWLNQFQENIITGIDGLSYVRLDIVLNNASTERAAIPYSR